MVKEGLVESAGRGKWRITAAVRREIEQSV